MVMEQIDSDVRPTVSVSSDGPDILPSRNGPDILCEIGTMWDRYHLEQLGCCEVETHRVLIRLIAISGVQVCVCVG